MAEYISKDKALNLDFKINVSLFESRRKTAERAVQAYADAISAIPAADVRPVVRAEWQSCEQDKPPCKWYSCDYCGFHALNKSNFCPNCGAKMQNSLEKNEGKRKKSFEKVEGE